MLSVEHVVHTVPPTYFYRVDLIGVKMSGSPLYMFSGNIALVFLIGNKVFNRNLFK